MILRKDYVQQIHDGKAQVEVEKIEEHNEMLNLIFPKRVKLGVIVKNMDIYYKYHKENDYGYVSYNTNYTNLPIIHASDIILDNTVIKVESEEHGKRVIEWWKEQGLNLDGVEGSAVGSCYGIYNGSFNFFNHDIAIRKGKKIITLPETFPSKWYMICDEENQDMGNEWLKANGSSYYKNIIGNAFCSKNNSGDRWFGYGGRASEYMDKDHPEYEKISTEQFLEHVYNPWKNNLIPKFKQENKMRTITWNQGQEIIDIACVGWKGKLFDILARPIVMKEPIEIKDSFYKEMRKACTKEQHELFDRIFGKEKEEIDLGNGKGIQELNLFQVDGDCDSSLMAIYCGSCENNIIWLNSERFKWELIDGYLLKVTNK